MLSVILFSIAGLGAAALLTGLALDKSMLWRAGLVVAALGLFGGMLYPPADRLKPGLDLAGGASLLYEVETEGLANPEEAIDQTIAVLKRRVDPEGVRNLVWRKEAGNRIEIQMPRPSREVEQRRVALETVEQEIEADNIARSEVLAAIESGALRENLEQFQRGVEGRGELLLALADAYRAYQEARAELEAMDRGGDEPAYIRQAAAVARQKQLYEQAMERVMATNLAIAELRRVLNRSAEPPAEDEPSPRERGLTELKQRHPQRVADIERYVEAYLHYEQVKGELDDPQDLIRLLKGAGVLEFRITANADADDLSEEQLNELRRELREKGPTAFEGRQWVWVEIDDVTMFADTPEEREALEENPAQYLAATRGLIGEKYGEAVYVLCWNTPDKSITQRQEGWAVDRASATVDQNFLPAVSFTLNSVGGRLMRQLSAPNVGRGMAMILDGRLISAPRINSALGATVLVTGANGFTEREQTYLVNTLNAGSLQARLSPEPISVRTVGPDLGEDNLRQGLESARDALIAVALFMILYYFFAGAVASLALLANIVIILGLMSGLDAAFTLPGIAGIVLTIGMCVDANVLIFERIREELNLGTEPETALRLGYQRAFSSIIDSNITNLIVCVILYQTATVEVRGFALTFGLGIGATLFTSLFMSRLIFDLWFRLFGFRKLRQLPTAVPAVDRLLTPNVRWLAKRYLFFGLSTVALIVALTLVVQRGRDLLDIEFRAGTEVAFELAGEQTLPLQAVRDRTARIAELYTADPGALAGEEAETAERLKDIVADRRDGLFDEQRRRAQARDAEFDPEAARRRIAETTDLSQLAAATVVSVGNPLGQTQVGDQTVNTYDAFSIVSLVEDAPTVSSAVKIAFADVLDVQAALSFAGDDADRFADAPVQAITSRTLGGVLGTANDTDVSEFLGGAAITLRDLDPAVSLEQIEDRLRAMRLQPDFEDQGYRPTRVIGLATAPGSVDRYTDAVVLVRDPRITFFANPEAWEQMAEAEWELTRAALQRDASLSKVSNFSSAIAQALLDSAIIAVVLSLLAIVAYIWFRFGSLRYGLAAVAALTHDVIIALGVVALTHFLFEIPFFHEGLKIGAFKLNLGLIAAMLTIIGYSLNDTIILFDRIRENRGKLAVATPAIIDMSINQTISRTALTSLTTLLAVGFMYWFGGEGIRGFAFALIIGVLVGTYSSIAIASPLLTLGAGLPIPKPEEQEAYGGETKRGPSRPATTS
jgi:SecD/SecF fusion protein